MYDRIIFTFSNKCNLQCPFCYGYFNGKKVIFENCLEIIKRCYENGLRRISFAGGDVLQNWEKAIYLHVADCVSDYEKCSITVLKWERMAIKYELTHQTEILGRILEEIEGVYEIEHNCLDKFVNHCIDWEKFHKYYN